MPEAPVPTQLDKFKEAARQLGTDDDPEVLAKLVELKPTYPPRLRRGQPTPQAS